jgi:hypothetical protein
MKLLTHIWNFFSFQGTDTEKNEKDFAFFKKCLYYMSAFGFARGLYLADTEQSFILFNLPIDNVFSLSLMCMSFQLCLATLLAYFFRFYGLFIFDGFDTTESAPTAKDERIINQLVSLVKSYESNMEKAQTKEVRESLTVGHINEMRELAKQLSTQKQTQFLHDSLTKKMQKLEKKLMNHKI